MLDSLINIGTALLAKTDAGKEYGVKPKIKERIEAEIQKIKDKAGNFDTRGLKKSPALKQTLDKFEKKSNKFIAYIVSDNILNPLADVFGNHLGDYDSVEAFEKALTKSESVKEMMNFFSKIMDIKNYTTLVQQITDFKKFDKLTTQAQINLLKGAHVVEKIKKENSALNVKKVEEKTKEMTTALCEEMGLSAVETAKLIKTFEELTQKFLPDFNAIRKELVKNFSPFFKREQDKAIKKHPQLKVHLKGEQSKKEITSQFQAKKTKDKVKKKVPKETNVVTKSVVAPKSVAKSKA